MYSLLQIHYVRNRHCCTVLAAHSVRAEGCCMCPERTKHAHSVAGQDKCRVTSQLMGHESIPNESLHHPDRNADDSSAPFPNDSLESFLSLGWGSLSSSGSELVLRFFFGAVCSVEAAWFIHSSTPFLQQQQWMRLHSDTSTRCHPSWLASA